MDECNDDDQFSQIELDWESGGGGMIGLQHDLLSGLEGSVYA